MARNIREYERDMSMRAITASILLGCIVVAGSAQASQYEAEPSAAPTQPMVLKTGKERLGEKATDEQRLDDCKVPFGRRTRARPTACPWDVEN
jgi:hypothetical protein